MRGREKRREGERVHVATRENVYISSHQITTSSTVRATITNTTPTTPTTPTTIPTVLPPSAEGMQDRGRMLKHFSYTVSADKLRHSKRDNATQHMLCGQRLCSSPVLDLGVGDGLHSGRQGHSDWSSPQRGSTWRLSLNSGATFSRGVQLIK